MMYCVLVCGGRVVSLVGEDRSERDCRVQWVSYSSGDIIGCCGSCESNLDEIKKIVTL